MSTQFSADRVFTFSCFEGLRLLRQYSSTYPNSSSLELLDIIRSTEADTDNLDMDASFELLPFIEPDCPLDGHKFYRGCVEAVLRNYRPGWLRNMRQGRLRFIRQLTPDAQDVFKAAGLLETPAPTEIVNWWDAVSGSARLMTDRAKLEQGRIAEKLTLDRERRDLQKKCIEMEPEWLGLDDNFAGYDVRSYDRKPSGSIVNRLIEVKSTTTSPMRFFVTRNEWTKAATVGDRYIFHVWNMASEPPELHTRTVEQVMPHIPSNNGKGTWETAAIPLVTH